MQEEKQIIKHFDPLATLNKQLTIPNNTELDKIDFIHTKSLRLKPNDLFISDLKWKYLIRTLLYGKNILIEGPSGSGKTRSILSLKTVFPERPFFNISMGNSTDPKSTLIGNTHFKQDTGTFFNRSLFVQAIQTKNAIILLDELSRAHPEAGNILMPVLDSEQRFLRLDDEVDSPTIPVATGVCFLATANIGVEYTSTRIMDRSLMDRFIRIVMEPLSREEESQLIQLKYPALNIDTVNAISEIVDITRQEVKKPDSKLSTIISTRASLEIAGLCNDRFSLEEAFQVQVYPFYSEIGDNESERCFIKQILQKFI
jgi:MoxR-like ATPase